MRGLGTLTAVLLFFPSGLQADFSQLWGQAGERWTPESRLPDFSHAGYRYGAPLPDVPDQVNVKTFGATGDGTTDDSNAFLKALQTVSVGAIRIPAGRYRLTKILPIDKSGVVLRGDGPGKTVLYFPRSLTEAVGDGATNAPAGSWSWSGGFISFIGGNRANRLAEVTAFVPRGSSRLPVSTVAGLSLGERLRLFQINTDGSLGSELYGGSAASPADFQGVKLIDFSFKIKAIEGLTLAIDRPLRVDIRPAWSPALYSERPTVEDSGVENLTIEFPSETYVGHHIEPGFNAIDFSQAENAWVAHVDIVNADSGVFLREGTRFCTLDDITFDATPGRERVGYGGPGENSTLRVAGHHGILAADFSQDNLIARFTFKVRYIHDLAVSAGVAGNVFSEGHGIDVNFDHHRRAPYENLFTDIDVGAGSRLWESGGDTTDGPPSGVRETFWNIRSAQPQGLPPWALEANVIGITTGGLSPAARSGNWFEGMAPGNLQPPDLYLAQKNPQAAGQPPAQASALAAVKVYPNPWRQDKHALFGITFNGLAPGSVVHIFSVSGRLVRSLPKSDTEVTWDLNNSEGDHVASGIYLFTIITDSGAKATGKLAVIR